MDTNTTHINTDETQVPTQQESPVQTETQQVVPTEPTAVTSLPLVSVTSPSSKSSTYITVMLSLLALTFVIPGVLLSVTLLATEGEEELYGVLFILPFYVGVVVAIVSVLTLPFHILRANPRYKNTLYGWVAVVVSLVGLAVLSVSALSA